MYLHSFSYYRALAILLIVAGHSFGMVGWNINTHTDRVVASLVAGATGMFVFISGYFFHFVFYSRFRYKDFMLKKFNAVMSPYLILTALAIVFYVYYLQTVPYKDQLFNGQPGLWNEHIWPILQYYWYGAASFPYWYIPFIMITFALSPLHYRYIQLGQRWQLGLLLGFSLVAIFMHRPLYNLSNFQSVLYYTPFYLLGILCSVHAETLKRKLLGKEWILLALAVLLALLESLLQDRFGNYHKLPWEWGGLDLMLPQKLALCLFFYIFLRRFDHTPNRLVDLVASTSFAIFFLHPWVIDISGLAMRSNGITFNHAGLLPLMVAAMTAISLAIAFVVKKLMGKHSLRVIGW